ncbi:MAG: V-type ATPase subunit [Treponema sp.]|nr:V-type ATPase subunit [Treponema sp.]
MTRYAWAYGYARSCGYQARSRLGSRAARLAQAGKLDGLWRELFGEDPPPAGPLAATAERRLRTEAGRTFKRIAGPEVMALPFFRSLLAKAEFALVKRLLSSLHGSPQRDGPRDWGEEELPLAPSFDLAAFPNSSAMFEGTRFSWIAERGFDDLAAAKNRLDRQYYEELWASLGSIPYALRASLASPVAHDVELENLVWALRLRRYYALSRDEIIPLLVRLRGRDCQTGAIAALALRPDVRADWAGWRWEAFVNDAPEAGQAWYFDVRRFERSLRRHRFAELRRTLHLNPSSYAPLYCLFRIQEYEILSIFAVIEGLQLKAPFAEIADFVGGLAEVGA